MEPIQWTLNAMPKSDDRNLSIMSLENVARARAFFRSFPQYEPTPMADLKMQAGRLGLRRLCVKDESFRFGLNAFKVLGGAFAMARYIAGATGKPIEEMTYDYLTGEQLLKDFGQTTFFTATDGNHGRGVAWAARQLGQRAVVRMPRGSVKTRFDNIAREGAEVSIEEMNYDDCVRLAASEAGQAERGVVLQDTAWAGYEEIPAWIMQGYGCMAQEAAEQLGERPTHIFVQAGVGCMASAVAGYFVNRYPEKPPRVIAMEAENAACLYKGACRGDGEPAVVGGALQTIMAGLACGEPNILSWDILRNHADAFLACPDWVSARGMRLLAAPMRGDAPVVSGESGAVGMGVVEALMLDERYGKLKQALGLDENSRVLLISTEGDTDPESYQKIVWGGAYPTPEK